MDNSPYFTWFTVAITVILSLPALFSPALLERMLFITGKIRFDGQWYRLVSPLFVHLDYFHLFFNMYSFFLFGSALESRLGAGASAAIYFASGVAANAVLLLLKRNEYEYRMGGASGAVTAVIFASAFVMPESSVLVFPVPVPIPALGYAVLFVFISLFAMRRSADGVCHEAHLAGGFFGIVLTLVFIPRAILASPLYAAGIVAGIVLVFIVLAKYPALLGRA
ncbi:MAG: rhomboid family intramembrane serine protease [Spirochaetes bacterium]|nr:MAG: rhomboid family intramembrane serine protease [Spirochaetota bacterium]